MFEISELLQLPDIVVNQSFNVIVSNKKSYLAIDVKISLIKEQFIEITFYEDVEQTTYKILCAYEKFQPLIIEYFDRHGNKTETETYYRTELVYMVKSFSAGPSQLLYTARFSYSSSITNKE